MTLDDLLMQGACCAWPKPLRTGQHAARNEPGAIRRGLVGRHGGQSDAARDEIRRLLATSALSMREIADTVGCSRTAVVELQAVEQPRKTTWSPEAREAQRARTREALRRNRDAARRMAMRRQPAGDAAQRSTWASQASQARWGKESAA